MSHEIDQLSHGQIRLPDGRQLAYSEIGDSQGPAVIYLHGTPASRLEITHTTYLQAFKNSGLRVIAIDRPGFGDSDPPTQPGHAALVADIEALLTHLNIANALAIGHSRGGLPTLALAALLPERVKAVGLFGSTGLPEDPDLLRNLTPTAGLMLRLVKLKPIVARRLLRINAWLDRRFPAGAVNRMSKVVNSLADAEQLRLVGRNWHQSLQHGMRRDPGWSVSDWRSWLVDPLGFEPAKATVPVLLWQGAEDTVCPPKNAEFMQRHIPGSQLRVLPDVGHLHTPKLLTNLIEATRTAAENYAKR